MGLFLYFFFVRAAVHYCVEGNVLGAKNLSIVEQQ